jgi:maltose O-acetyltransferase
MHNPLRPHSKSAGSRAWGFYVNVVGASPLMSSDARYRLYRWAGIETQTKHIGPACYFHPSDIRIGLDSMLNHGCHFENVAAVDIGAHCGLATNVLVMTSTHDVGGPDQRWGRWGALPVKIEDGCWIGARAILFPGVVVGAGCLVAAGAVVRESCEPNGLYAGVPAKRIRDLPV